MNKLTYRQKVKWAIDNGYIKTQPYKEINCNRIRWYKAGCYYNTNELSFK